MDILLAPCLAVFRATGAHFMLFMRTTELHYAQSQNKSKDKIELKKSKKPLDTDKIG